MKRVNSSRIYPRKKTVRNDEDSSIARGRVAGGKIKKGEKKRRPPIVIKKIATTSCANGKIDRIKSAASHKGK